MREALLRRCVYSRWRDWGTFDVITHHSLVRLTGAWDGLRDSVINPFLTQYTVMAAGALLQRATAMKLSEECADISSAYFNGNETEALNDRILRLKRAYVYAQNNIFLNHFTAQEQGIDEFDMMRSEMYIKDSLKNLSYKVNGIYDFATASAEEEENHLLNMLTYFGYSYRGVGENIAHHGTVAKAEAAFMSSSSHRQNILGSQWTRVGIGICLDDQGYVYMTQIFAR